ncbi:MAG: DUF47 family protein [Chthonomonadales bacterium]|nr:DUF47 family protein [Chthonomonadales bacterium]
MAQGVAGRLQRLMHAFLPKEEEFFRLFAAMGDRAHEGALLLQALFDGNPDQTGLRDGIGKLENEVDDLRHDCTRRLNQTFVTPIMFDRQDIIDVGDELDNVVDFTRAAIDRTVLYRVARVPEAARALARILAECTHELAAGLHMLEKLRDSRAPFIERVNTLENEGDRILKQGLADLFDNERDPIEIIKWKEIFDYVEEAIDHTEDAVNTIEAALVKNS